ncbi:MAG: hypothetical protein AAF787_14245 [Chloroflexota bacterium]
MQGACDGGRDGDSVAQGPDSGVSICTRMCSLPGGIGGVDRAAVGERCAAGGGRGVQVRARMVTMPSVISPW